jgi:hypothetical protein
MCMDSNKIHHLFKRSRFHPTIRFRSTDVEHGGDFGSASIQPEEKYVVKHAIFRGDPREFLG